MLVASANAADFVGAAPDRVIGASLADLLGAEAAGQVASAAGGPGRGTTLLTVAGYDVLVHESGRALVVELLRVSGGTRPLTFTDTYRRAQSALSELNDGLTYERLLEVAVRRVRELTGFDRVMVYRFDADWNGEVVAEDRREDLKPFLGLRYPATDIPAPGARALRAQLDPPDRRRRLRAGAARPVANPLTGRPLDLSDAWLRSVSPIHVEYLQNMGVGRRCRSR